MAIKYSFVDGVLYGTDDVNDIIRSVTGAGVSPFQSKEEYAVSDLNSLTADVVAGGTSHGGCKCSVAGLGESEIVVTVAQGMIFFESGVRLEVDSDGYEIHIGANLRGYIFAHYNPSLQICDILFETELRQDGENVPLAYISESGEYTDLRKTAESKIATMGKNVILKRQFERMDMPVADGNDYIVAKVQGVDTSRFNQVVIVTNDAYGDSNLKYYPELGYYTGFYDLNESKMQIVFCCAERVVHSGSREKFYETTAGYEYYVRVIGGELCLLCRCDEDEKETVVKENFGCTACFM